MPPKKTHTHPDGTVMTGATHTSKSKVIKKGRPPKPKPLTQKAEKEMMGQEDIASTTKELDDAKARAVARMAKAREAKAEKKKAVVAPSKENITLKIDEAPYGFTASGKKRSKPLKEKPPKAPKPIKDKPIKAPPPTAKEFNAYIAELQKKKEAPPKAPKPLKEKPIKAPIKKKLTLQERILTLPDELRRYTSEFVALPVSIKTARRYIQLLQKGKDILFDLYNGQGDFWTQDGYYTSVGDKNVDEIQEDLEETHSDFVDVLKEAKVWFKKTYKGQTIDSSQELRKSDETLFEPESFGLEENEDYDADAEYDEYDEFNGKYHLGDYRDLEEGIETAMGLLKQIIDVLKKGGFISPVEIEEEEEDEEEGEGLKGGALSAKELKGLLGASYEGNANVGDFILDKGLSTSTSKVYHNPKNNQTVVAHRGTEGLVDWGNNLVYAVGGKSAYKMTPRYKEAEAVQRKAESKYGATNVSTIGHSQGGLQSELLGGKSKEIITLNKATRPFESNKNKNQTDVRSGRDVVSALNPFEKKSSKNVEIQGETYNPLAEHSGDVLDRLDENQMIGEGIRRMVKGRGTEARRFIANMLRSRFNPKELKLLSPALEAEATQSLSNLYPNIRKVNYNVENIQGLLNSLTHSADATGFHPKNPYMDYEERPNHIALPTTYDGKPTLPPQELIDVALNAYFDMVYNLHRNLSGRGRSEWVFGDEKKTIPTALQPFYQKFLETKAQRIVPKFLATVAKFPSKEPEAVLERGLLNIKKNKMKKDAWWVDIKHPNYYPLSRLFDAWLRSVNAVNEAEKNKIERDIETEKNKIRDNFTAFKEKYKLDELPAEFSPALSKDASAIPKLFLTQASRNYKRPNPLPKAPPLPVAPAPAKPIGGKETPAFKPKAEAFPKLGGSSKGSGLPIDFESINWGSLTEQMKAYNSSRKKKMDLEGFARMIVADPKSFQKRTQQRARFYINVLLPKKNK